MDASIERSMERVVYQMEERLGEEITIDDLARAALFSKFHFSRLFQRTTGVSPGRFLSALRLERAKQLLVSTSLNVVDISHRVGYTSVGTFSSRFSSSVGVSPTAYRRLGGFNHSMVPAVGDRAGAGDDQIDFDCSPATVTGRILAPPAVRLGRIFVGLFPDPLPQGRPVRCDILAQPGTYQLRDVPRGSWYLTVYAMSAADEPAGPPANGAIRPEPRQPARPYVRSVGPIRAWPGSTTRPTDIQLRPKRPLDPPVLIALPDLNSQTRPDEAVVRPDRRWHRDPGLVDASRPRSAAS
jgi:AraC family transcriptional regulator